MTTPEAVSKAFYLSAPIGVFDSGVGGLSVLEEMSRVFPDEHFVYLGDTAHMPYGEKSPTELKRLVLGIVDYLLTVHRVKMLVVACNSSAGVLADYWANECPVPVIEPMAPITRWLCQHRPYQRIGLLATEATVASNRYQQHLAEGNANIDVSAIACPGFAKRVEDSNIDTLEGRALLRTFLKPLLAQEVEAIILGCTHYPFARKVLESLLEEMSPGKTIPLLDPASWMGQAAVDCLQQKTLSRFMSDEPVYLPHYFVSGDATSFDNSAAKLDLQFARLQPSQQVQLLPVSPI